MVVNILIASVGGQGGHTLARVLAYAAVLEGYNVRVGESLGMSQRYGSVKSFVRLGNEVRSPTFGYNEANYLIGLELLESLRNVHYLRLDGKALVASVLKPPFMSRDDYLRLRKEDVILRLKHVLRDNLVIVDADEAIKRVGNPRTLNMVLLGAFLSASNLLSIRVASEAVIHVLPSKYVEDSLKALKTGYLLMRR